MLLRRDDAGRWIVRRAETLEPCRGIAIEFEGHDRLFVYHLFANEVIDLDEHASIVRVRQWLPEDPPRESLFATWVTQSLNQSAGDLLNHVELDVRTAYSTGSFVLTDSLLVAELLRQSVNEDDVAGDVASLTLQLDLPVVTSASCEQLMRLRQEEGASFQALRNRLDEVLREVRHVDDEDERRKRLRDLEHELMQTGVREVEGALEHMKQKLLGDAVVAGASLAVSVPTQGLSLVGLVGAAVSAYRTWKLNPDTKGHPAYFLWRLAK